MELLLKRENSRLRMERYMPEAAACGQETVQHHTTMTAAGRSRTASTPRQERPSTCPAALLDQQLVDISNRKELYRGLRS